MTFLTSNSIKLGVTDLSFHHMTAALVTQILQDMGFEVQREYAPHQDNFINLKQGKIDLLSSAWLPSSHGIYKADVEEVISVTELGLHYEPYALWGVSDYVPVSAVNEVSDLLNPEVMARMHKHIQGINSGAGITRFSIQMMQEYGLSDAGYTFSPGTEDACFGAFEQAVSNKQWVVVPLWKPQFLHHKYTIRELVEPKGLLGIVDRAVLLIRDDKKALFSSQQLARLDTLRFSNEIIAQLDYKVSREGAAIDSVANTWLKTNGFLN
ncbi:glycine betaine ABC transporter substrate-binding protein [Paraglaciecola chathamensis]|uniref:Glycine/betaine ABC transporter n=1 Tax=Paraglaciecola chathamensis TaxID=368405 RepID=A0A8H9IKS8_9ALTE|nr:glycine betaine ABC transporter substrate-binding protein [Paraglaciecola oceanifecundans]GGZ82116.1 glycine/betaine ABC transporter [Paraglaciecola oceanifecundans]